MRASPRVVLVPFLLASSVAVGACASGAVQRTESDVAPLPQSPAGFQSEEAEQFLQRARIVRVWELGEGITRPQGVLLELDGFTHNAVFKDVDERRQGVTQFPDGTVDVNFRDSWETEVAAYRVDRMIGLGMVPATIERAVRGAEGSLQWWVESMVNETERVEQGLVPPDREAWNRLQLNMYLFDELIANVDRNMDNLLITEDFQIRLIDHSRSFRDRGILTRSERLTRFSRSLLDGIERLTFDDLDEAIGRHVSDSDIRQLLARRDAILELARQRVAELGEAAVIYR